MSNLDIALRPWVREDAPALFAAIIDSAAELGPWSPWLSPGFSEAMAGLYIEKTLEDRATGGGHELAIVGREGDEEIVLGSCGINEIAPVHGVANVGYWVHSSHTKRGIATSVVRQLADWTFANTELNRLEIVVAVGNEASIRVARKVGAVYEGRQAKRLLIRGQALDAEMFALLRP